MNKGWVAVAIAMLLLLLVLPSSSFGAQIEDITDVTVVFMNHLDVGFNHGEASDGRPCSSPYGPTCGLSSSIVNNYFDNWYPKALRTASLVQQFNETAGYTYTTHGWLLSLFMQCDPSNPPVWWDREEIHCPSKERQKEMATAVVDGSIWWHASPFNGEPELVDESLFLSMVNLTQNLATVIQERARDRSDTLFERRAPTALRGPIAMSQRDVPGLTQSVIPLLDRMGVRLISVGVNSASSPPAVPHAFRWFDAAQSSEIFALYHPNGYGWMQGDVLDPYNDCYLLDGSNSTLCLAFKGDNAGPQGFFELQEDYFQLRHTFPNAAIRAGTFDEFVPVLESVKELLPIVTEEIGDTWLYGCPSDPKKLALFRALQRCRRTSLELGEASVDDLQLFDFLLMKSEEHTWGEDVKTYLGDWAHWSNAEFHQQLAEENSSYVTIINSWYDQRFFLSSALEALQNSSATQETFARCEAEIAPVTKTERGALGINELLETGWQPSDPLSLYTAGEFEVSFNDTTGAIQFLSRNGQPSIATEQHQLGVLTYTTYDGRDYGRFLSEYLYCHPADCTWALKDYGKPNMSLSGHPNSTTATAELEHFFTRDEANGMEFLAWLSFPEELHMNSGSPSRALVFYNLTSTVEIDLNLHNKTATRLAESGWMTFNPTLHASGEENVWRMDKMGMWVDPLNVVLNGSRSLHGIRTGVALNATWSNSASPDSNEDVAVVVESLDAGVLAPGGDSLMNFTNNQPDVAERGMSFNLFNNLWGTNYVMWYPFGGESPNIRYRWRVSVGLQQARLQ